MTREEGPERTQRTVAELLAKYGNSPDESAPRRRRRRADDAEETAPQAIIDRVLSDSGTNLPRIPADDPPQPPQVQAPTSRHRPVPQPPQPPPPVTPPPSIAAQALQPTQRQMPPVAPPERQRRMPQSSQSLPRPTPQPKPQPSSQWPAPPAEPGGLAARLDGRQDSRTDMRAVPVDQPPMPAEGVTEQMPRIPDELSQPGNRTGQHPAPHRVARTARGPQPSMPLPQPPPAYPQHEPDERDNYPTEYHGFDPVGGEATQYAEAPQFGEATQYAEPPQFGESTQYVEGLEREEDYEDSRRSMRSIEDERPIGADDFDEDEDEGKPASPVKEWLSMAGQLAIGVIGGAALWLGFNWLWGKLPAAALGVALVVIIGLVWVVRKIRRADDLQTTILTVLVGLVVTVSPAAMLLLNR
ncbi:hypothetical protein JOF56_002693 [Kibdelosporangium banguiense]|uniref:Uncharacterized protein n=1 Tax=Kibdelosporangium banguiense TaxID=1365924 RepID=A0ABS4TD00_9PSEU|nr:hypothetical protein [Kibdelosporangium banguiense]MBP2322308.1 hypothetical protein [Kibdelosporangium banguiense]